MSTNDCQELRECPFCGGEASVKVLEYDDDCKVWGVFCDTDLISEYSHGHYIDNYPTEAEAIAAWNTRVERTCRSTTDDEAWCFVCSECGKSFPRNQLRLAHNHGEINYCPNCGSKVVE